MTPLPITAGPLLLIFPIRFALMPPLPAPPRPSRIAPWLLLALLWGLTTAFLVLGSQAPAAFGG